MRDKFKAYYVLRSDLKMSPGKACVQVGHGTDLIHIHTAGSRNIQKWKDDGRIKIVLSCDTEEQLSDIFQGIEDECRGFWSKYIFDLGFNEVEPNTVTGLVVMPDMEKPETLESLKLWGR